MAEDDVTARSAADGPPVERPLLDLEHRGALDRLLLDALGTQLDVDAVATGDEEKLVDLADEGALELGIDRVAGSGDRAPEVRHRLPEVVVDREGARHARDGVGDVEDESGRPAGDEQPRSAASPVTRDLDRPDAVIVPATGVRPSEQVLGHRVLDLTEVLGDGVADRPVRPHMSAVEEDSPAAERLDDGHVVTDEQDGAPLAGDVPHPPEALPLERRIADGEDLVDEQDL